MDDEVNENGNREDIISKLVGVFGNSSAFSGPFIRVAVVDNNITKIRDSFKNIYKALERKDSINTNINNQINITNGLLNNLINSLDKKLIEEIRNLGREQEKEDEKRKNFPSITSSFIKNIPVIGSLLSPIPGLLQKWIELQWSNLQAYKELNNSGVFFKDSFSDLHRYASEAGISLNELSKSLIQHSQGVARLYGVTDNGVSAFSRLLKGVRETGSEIGMNFKTSVQIAGQMAEDSSLHLFMTGQSMENLVGQTEIYQKQLQKLSLATGKSTESILAESKARDDEVTKKLWLSDPKNKMLYNFLKAQGIDEKVIQAYITGVPTAEYVQASVTSRAVGDYLENIRGINRSKYQMSDEEFSSSLMNAMKGFDINTAREELGFFSDNMLFTEQFAASVGGFRTSLGMLQSIPLLINKDFDDLIGKNLVSEKIDAFVSKFKSLWENMLKDFSMDEDKMNKAFDLMDRFFIRLHSVIDSLLNGNFMEGLDKLFHGSIEETTEVINSKTKEKQATEQEIKNLRERAKVETDENEENELKSQIKDAQDRLLKLNREIYTLNKEKDTFELKHKPIDQKFADTAADIVSPVLKSILKRYTIAGGLAVDGGSFAYDSYRSGNPIKAMTQYEYEDYNSSIMTNLFHLLNPMKFGTAIEALADKGLHAYFDKENIDIKNMSQQNNNIHLSDESIQEIGNIISNNSKYLSQINNNIEQIKYNNNQIRIGNELSNLTELQP